MEAIAKVAFSCNSARGTYKLTVTNAQVIKNDGVSRWDTLSMSWEIASFDLVHNSSGSADLVQNTTNGLFGLTQTGVLTDPAACASGAQFLMTDTATEGSWLWFLGSAT